MSVEIWKIEKNLCRCCHAEGDFDNLAEPRVYLEQEEIYFNMLRECFNIEIPPVPGELCALTYSICKACILRLRDASSFKKQVQHCEERFMALYCNNSIQVLNSQTPIIKIEDSESDIDYNEDFLGLNDENDEKNDIKQDEDNPDSYEDKNLTLMKGKSKMKSKSHKSNHTPKIRSDVKKTKSSVKKKKGTDISTHCTMTEDSEGAVFACKICPNIFKKRNLFKQHYRHVHLRQRPKLIGCYYCEEKVAGHMRAYHLENVHGVPAPSCGACGKKFSYPFQVLKHQKTYHMGERKFVCNICDQTFASRGNLVQHEVKHSSLRPFKCDYCEESFKLKKHLTRHRLTHLNQKQN